MDILIGFEAARDQHTHMTDTAYMYLEDEIPHGFTLPCRSYGFLR